jgi:cytochrome P450
MSATAVPVENGADTTMGIPAGPRWPAWWTTWKFLKDRKAMIPVLHERFGDTFSIKILPGPRTFVIFSDPADVKEIFAADPSQFHAGEGNAILEPVMGSHSLLIVDDEEHRRSRKLLMPAFSGPTMKAYRPLVEAIAAAEVDSWNDGDTLVTLDRMNAITLDVILQVVFGVTDEERLAVLRPKVRKMVNINASMLLAWSYPGLFRIPPWRGYFKNQQEVDEILFAEIRERRAEHDLEGRADVLSRLLRAGEDDTDVEPLSDREMRDQLVTLLLAGHETTASALSWTLHELGRHPDLLKRAVEAADDADDAFLDACLKEAMRVHPVIDFVARTLQSEQVVAGRTLPRKVTVTPSIMLSHSREANFADAHEYRPDRFLTQGEVAANTWIPFGGGVRRCIGAAFSLMEGAAVLGEVLRRYEVTADQPAPNRLRNITNVPSDKAPLRLRSR